MRGGKRGNAQLMMTRKGDAWLHVLCGTTTKKTEEVLVLHAGAGLCVCVCVCARVHAPAFHSNGIFCRSFGCQCTLVRINDPELCDQVLCKVEGRCRRLCVPAAAVMSLSLLHASFWLARSFLVFFYSLLAIHTEESCVWGLFVSFNPLVCFMVTMHCIGNNRSCLTALAYK